MTSFQLTHINQIKKKIRLCFLICIDKFSPEIEDSEIFYLWGKNLFSSQIGNWFNFIPVSFYLPQAIWGKWCV